MWQYSFILKTKIENNICFFVGVAAKEQMENTKKRRFLDCIGVKEGYL